MPLNNKEVERLADAALDIAEGEKKEKGYKVTETMRLLERRLKNRIIDVRFSDCVDEGVIPIRPMSIAEQRRLNELRQKLQMDPLKAEPLDDEFCRLLADLCHDKNYNFNFWKAGRYSPDVPAKIIQGASSVTLEEEKDIRFLPLPRRAEASSSSSQP